MQYIARRLMHYLYRPLLLRYLRKERSYRFEDLDIIIGKSVFHPAFFGSTKAFIEFLKRQPLAGCDLLEMGCGSGLLSLVAAREGARVTAVDINPAAVECTRANARRNGIEVRVEQSDVFDNLPVRAFDRIVVNPPFYKGKPSNDAAFAWYCGAEFDFFRKFFGALPGYAHAGSRTWMILSEVCDLAGIRRVAGMHNCSLHAQYRSRKLFEQFTVFEIIIQPDLDHATLDQ
jgi:release factor glutamine methyltransferase